MLKRMKVNPENMYLSQRLTDRLSQMKNYPLTVIEAPMGYGKTMGSAFLFEEKYDRLCLAVSKGSLT